MKNSSEIHWKPHYTLQESGVSTTLRDWLVHSGSFMQRLAERGAMSARVQVLSQEWQHAESWENTLLNIQLPTEVLTREVMILSEGKYWMFARSVFPRQMLTGEEAMLADLKTRPLGTVLFNHPSMKRGEFFYTCLRPGMSWYQKVMYHLSEFVEVTETKFPYFWASYSLFHLQEKTLLLTEVFLPDIAIL